MKLPGRGRALASGPLVVAGATSLVVGTTVLLRYLTFHAPAYDLGFFDQVAEQTARGHLFATSFVPYSFLGEHWEPLLGVVAQLDRIVATPVCLLIVQALAAGAAPFAAGRLARTWLPESPSAPLIAALAMACSPLFTNGAAFDYHTESLTPALALFALDAAATRRLLRFALLLLLLATIKEDALLIAAGVGWISWRADRTRLGLAAVVAGVGGFFLVTSVVMPHFRAGATSDLLVPYAWLAPGSTSAWTTLTAALTHPGAVVTHLLSAPALQGWVLALLPLALLPVVSGWALLGALPVLLVPLLSNLPGQTELHFQYGLEAIPLLLACSLLGWRHVAVCGWARRACGGGLAAASLAAYIIASPLPGGLRFDASTVQGLGRRADVENVLNRIPASAAVSAQTGLVAHVSGRDSVWEFPAGLGVRYVVLDELGPISSQSHGGYPAALRSLPTDGYRVVARAAGVTLWER